MEYTTQKMSKKIKQKINKRNAIYSISEKKKKRTRPMSRRQRKTK